jgi:hypothetical protein
MSDDETSTDARQEGGSAQDPSENIMAPCTFSVHLPYGTQFTFWSLMFAVGEDENHELLTQGLAPKQLAPVYGHAPYLPVSSSTSNGACLGLNPYAWPYHRAAKTTQGIPIGAPIFQPSAETSSSSAPTVSPDQASTDDYPEIRGSTYWNSTDEGCLIILVAPAGGPLHNSSSRHPTSVR